MWKRLVDTRPGSAIDPQVLAADLLQLSASGDYEQVDYKLKPDPHTLQDGLVFNLKETDWGPNFLKLGIDLHTDFQGEAGFNVRLQHRRRGLTEGGTEWHNQLEIGSVTGLKTELYHPWGGDHDRFVSAHAAVRKEKIDLYDLAGNHYAIYGRRTMTLGLDHGWQPIIAEGEWHGEILSAARVDDGFGYDPLFYVRELDKSAAELEPAEKNRRSHRGQALARLVERLQTRR